MPIIDSGTDATDPDDKFHIYYIHPGRVDLVARRGQQLLLVEARGDDRSLGIAVPKVVQQIAAHIDVYREDRSYGLLLPDDPVWLAALRRHRPPTSEPVTVFLVSKQGGITAATWGPRG